MKPLRRFFDTVKPRFTQGGSLEKYFPIYDVFENLFYSSDKRTFGSVHIRDSIDLQKVMVVVWMATFPAMFYGMYNLGYQSLSAFEQIGSIDKNDWHFFFIDLLCNYNPKSILDCIWFGACYFIPIYVVTFLVGIAWEVVFAKLAHGSIPIIFFLLKCFIKAPSLLPISIISFGLNFFFILFDNFLNSAFIVFD